MEGFQLLNVLLLNVELERHGEEWDGVVVSWLRVVGGVRRGLWCIAAVQGYIQFADVVDQCDPCCRQGEFLVHVF